MAKDEEETKELAPVFGGKQITIAESEQLMRALEETQNEGARMGDVSFMSFSGKRGIYKIGQEGREPGAQEPFLVAIPAFEIGWMCWKGGKPVAKRMANISQPRIPDPDMNEFGPFDERKGEGWQKSRAITARSLENSEQIYFTISSKSGVAAMADLQREVLSRMKEGQPCWPVIIFDREEFEAQSFKNFKPTMDIVKWVTTQNVQALADPDIDPMSLMDEEEQPKDRVPEPEKRRRL